MAFFHDHLEDDFARTKVWRHDTQEHAHEEARYYSICPVLPDDLPTGNAGLNCRPAA